jgi:hypothetical protein
MLDAKKSKHCQKNRYEQMDEYYVEIAKKYSDCTQYQKIIKCLKDSNVDIFDMNDVDFLKICFGFISIFRVANTKVFPFKDYFI